MLVSGVLLYQAGGLKEEEESIKDENGGKGATAYLEPPIEDPVLVDTYHLRLTCMGEAQTRRHSAFSKALLEMHDQMLAAGLK